MIHTGQMDRFFGVTPCGSVHSKVSKVTVDLYSALSREKLISKVLR